MPDLTVVIVSWNAIDYLRECLELLKDCVDHGACDVIVVDNDSNDGSPEMVRSSFGFVSLIEAGANLGFARGNNVGLAQAKTAYVLLLNSDTRVSEEALSGMLDVMKSRAGHSGPDLPARGRSRQSDESIRQVSISAE